MAKRDAGVFFQWFVQWFWRGSSPSSGTWSITFGDESVSAPTLGQLPETLGEVGAENASQGDYDGMPV